MALILLHFSRKEPDEAGVLDHLHMFVAVKEGVKIGGASTHAYKFCPKWNLFIA